MTIDILGDLSLWEYYLTKNELKNIVNKINTSLESVDYRIANLEAPIVRSPHSKIAKSGPNLKTDSRALDFLRDINIDAYTLANNHIGDYGVEGVRDTIKFLDDLGKEHVGTEYYECLVPMEYPVLRKELDVKVSFISVCENEFGLSQPAVEGACGFNPRRIQMTINTEKKRADYVIIIFHGGIENYSFPSPLQKQRYHTLVDQGANAVIGMHSHCPVGYEIYRDAPIVYGTGNFYFPRRYPSLYQSWNYGYIVHLHLRRNEKINFHFSPYKTSCDGRAFNLIEEAWMQKYMEELCDAIQDDQKIAQLFHAWVLMRGKAIANSLSVKLFNCDLQEFCPIKNALSCEAHNEVLKTYLNIIYVQKCRSEYHADDMYQKQKYVIKKYISIDRFNGSVPKNHEIKQVLWGFGDITQREYADLMRAGYDTREILIVDSDNFKQDLYYYENAIASPQAAMEKCKNAIWSICTPRKYFDEIHEALMQSGIPEKNINDLTS